MLDTCQRIAAEKFAPFNRLVDVQEPRLENGVVVLPQCAYDAARAYVDSGMLAASQDYDVGGMQLPYVVELAANAFFAKAGIGLGGGGMLTVGNANLLLAHGTRFPSGRYSVLAGFVEPGESLEEAVERELFEEVGIRVRDIRYFGSQPWPFPHGIMIGFRAQCAAGEITLEDGELAEAGWYNTENLPTVPQKLSIARRLIDAWATEHGIVIDQP